MSGAQEYYDGLVAQGYGLELTDSELRVLVKFQPK